MYKGRSFTTARIAILSLSLIFLMIIIIIKDYDGSVEACRTEEFHADDKGNGLFFLPIFVDDKGETFER
ncbi:hypothetical protein Tco_0975397 [Tanacetum coccineum]|uniref:Uncharacterized protein n=1 Tax=Tanacetum coccineum TaxID=301880 RepID=A0ABQ5EE88_9ASTR